MRRQIQPRNYQKLRERPGTGPSQSLQRSVWCLVTAAIELCTYPSALTLLITALFFFKRPLSFDAILFFFFPHQSITQLRNNSLPSPSQVLVRNSQLIPRCGSGRTLHASSYKPEHSAPWPCRQSSDGRTLDKITDTEANPGLAYQKEGWH